MTGGFWVVVVVVVVVLVVVVSGAENTHTKHMEISTKTRLYEETNKDEKDATQLWRTFPKELSVGDYTVQPTCTAQVWETTTLDNNIELLMPKINTR